MEPDRAETPPPSSPDVPATAPRREGGALARLRDRVEAAAAEIERLREENARLAERVSGIGKGGAGVEVSGDPAQLRASIQGFIDAIDRVLDGEASP
ncbi:MAG: hypothetical protein AAGI52_06930 [Bacteroidota bacterium]